MNLDIRKAILDNIAMNKRTELAAIINDAMQSKEEKTLPGLGFLFELIWEQSNTDTKEQLIETLELGVKQATTH